MRRTRPNFESQKVMHLRRTVRDTCCDLLRPLLPKKLVQFLFILLLTSGVFPKQFQPNTAAQELQPQQKIESLGQLAREERARKNKSEQVKVYTEEDLARLRASTVSIVGPKNLIEASAQDQIVDNKPRSNRGAKFQKIDEKYWRERFLGLQNRMDALDLKIKTVKDDIARYESGNLNPLPTEVWFPLPELSKEKEELQKQIDLLQEEGRKAGAPPGLFR
jgi:hypothetical protein